MHYNDCFITHMHLLMIKNAFRKLPVNCRDVFLISTKVSHLISGNFPNMHHVVVAPKSSDKPSLNRKSKLINAFRFKDRIPKELTSGVVYKFQRGLWNESYYGECARHLNVRIGEHIGISPLTKKKVKSKGKAVSDHLLLRNHSPSLKNFSVLTKENRKFVLKLILIPRIYSLNSFWSFMYKLIISFLFI